jgi:methylenetetrahydrofolate reductase (NADPH)
LRDFGDDRPAIRAFGIDVATDLCARLLEGGAPGLHFYTLNQAEATSAICKNLNLIEQAA